MSHSLCVKEYVKGWAIHEVELNPSNFYEAEDEDELHDMVFNLICDEYITDVKGVNLSNRELDYELPKEFIEEWKSLKGLK